MRPLRLEVPLGLDQHAHPGAVHEAQVAQVEHHAGMRLCQHLLQAPRELGCRDHVQLTDEREHDAPVIVPAFDRKLGRDGRIVDRPGRFTFTSSDIRCSDQRAPIGRAVGRTCANSQRGEREEPHERCCRRYAREGATGLRPCWCRPVPSGLLAAISGPALAKQRKATPKQADDHDAHAGQQGLDVPRAR